MSKTRLTVTIEPRLLRVAERAVAAGRARSVSSWVNGALEQRVEKEERLRAMQQAVESFEKAYGEITEGELAEQVSADAALVLLAQDGDEIVTSDPEDIVRLAEGAGRAVSVLRV